MLASVKRLGNSDESPGKPQGMKAT